MDIRTGAPARPERHGQGRGLARPGFSPRSPPAAACRRLPPGQPFTPRGLSLHAAEAGAAQRQPRSHFTRSKKTTDIEWPRVWLLAVGP